MIYLDNAATSFPKPEGVGERMKYYVEQVGATVNRASYSPARQAGRTVLTLRERLPPLFRENTRLVLINHTSNVCGVLQDARLLGELCAARGIPLALDAALEAIRAVSG